MSSPLPYVSATELSNRLGAPSSTAQSPAGARPWTRWWWLQGPYQTSDIDEQLDWLKQQGFGGVELAWLFPEWDRWADRTSIPAWLGEEWSALVAHTKQACDKRGLGCDFTLGSCWPFGDSHIVPEKASQTFSGPSEQTLHLTWEGAHGRMGRVLDHLTSSALRDYAQRILNAMQPALAGAPSGLFCDSLEVNTRMLWHPRLWDEFVRQFGYRLEDYCQHLDMHPDVRYDYRTLIAEVFQREFFETFVAICRENRAVARVQCHGAPVDLLAAYATVDIPESEAILFEPHFSRIAASAAALTGRNVVSCETFTCLYGFPGEPSRDWFTYWKREQIGDLKLLADTVFANGVNQIVWHGTPYNSADGQNEFYASVHVGRDSAFLKDLPDFNHYMETVCSLLRLGEPQSELAAWLPLEDNRMADRVPDAERTPAANYRWELRHVRVPRELEAYQPLWVTYPFLAQSKVCNGRLQIGSHSLGALWIDCEWIAYNGLNEIVRLAEEGLPVCLKRLPRQPGRAQRSNYSTLLKRLTALPQVVDDFTKLPVKPVISGDDLPLFWSRRISSTPQNLEAATQPGALYFLAHPACRKVKYPLRYRQSDEAVFESRQVSFASAAGMITVNLEFGPGQSLVLFVGDDGSVQFVDIGMNR